MQVINGIKVVIEGMEGKTDKLEVRFTHNQRVRKENRWLFFPTFEFFVKNFQISIRSNFAFFSDFDNSRRDKS